jgi:hypothetical protein
MLSSVYVTKARAATELVPAVEAALGGQRFVSAPVRRFDVSHRSDRRQPARGAWYDPPEGQEESP